MPTTAAPRTFPTRPVPTRTVPARTAPGPAPRRVRWGQQTIAWCALAVILTGLGHLTRHPLTWVGTVALLIAAGATAALGWRTNHRRDRQLAALLVAQHRLAGIVELMSWKVAWKGWPGEPAAIRVRFVSSAAAIADPFKGVLVDAVNSAWKASFSVASLEAARGRARLVARPMVSQEPRPEQAMVDRAVEVVRQVFGAKATLVGPEVEDGELDAFTVRHQAGAKLSNAEMRNRVEDIVSSMLPGRWRAGFDLPTDTIRFSRRPQLPTMVHRPTDAVRADDPNFLHIPQAIDEDGNVCYWDISGVMAHQLKAGRTRTGKTVSLIGDAVEAARRGFRVCVIDPKRIEFLGMRDWPNVELVATAATDQVVLINYWFSEMMDRYRRIEEDGASEKDFVRTLIIIDEYRQFYDLVTSWWKSIKVTGMPSTCPVFDQVSSMLRLAAAARIHIVMGTQRPDAEFLGGEALAVDTPIPTPDGWTTMGQITEGDQVFGPNGRPVTVIATTAVAHDRPCYRITFSDGTTIDADANHLWQVTTTTQRTRASQHPTRSRTQRWPNHATLQRQIRGARRRGLPETCSVSEFETAVVGPGQRVPLLRRGVHDGRFSVRPMWTEPAVKGRFPTRVYRSADLVDALLLELSNPPRTWAAGPQLVTTEHLAAGTAAGVGWGIPATKPVETPEVELPIDPWLLGLWLGDGHHATATIVTADTEVLDRIEALGYQVVHYARYNYGIVIGGRGHHRPGSLKEKLRQAGVLGNKHVPPVYLRASRHQRAELLAGLLDADGTVGVRGTRTLAGQVSFTNTNRRLIDAVAELAASLGFVPTTRRIRKAGIEAHPNSVAFGSPLREMWAVKFTPDCQVFGIDRKQRALEPSLTSRDRTPVRYVASVAPIPSVPVRCITVDSEDHLYLAGPSFIPTHNCRDNFSSRAALGALSPEGARMMFDSHNIGTRIPRDRQGRGTWAGDGKPKEVQYFFTPDPRKAHKPEELELLARLRPATTTWPRQHVVYPDDHTVTQLVTEHPSKTAPIWMSILNATLEPLELSNPSEAQDVAVDHDPIDDTTHETEGETESWTEPEMFPAGKLGVGDMLEHGTAWGTITDITTDQDSDQLLVSWLSDDGGEDALISISDEECLLARTLLG